MAEVQFLGIGAQGFPDPSVQILVGDRISEADVTNDGVVPAPQGTLDIEREILAPSEVLPSEFTSVQFFSSPPILPPFSENPNDNEILFFVDNLIASTGPILVLMVPATIPTADGMVLHPKPVPNDIRLFAGPNVPSGLSGKIIQFIAPTGASVPMPIQGVTGRIAAIAAPAASGDPDYPIAVSITFDSPLPVAAVKGDRFVVRSSDRTLRRTPVIEIVLE
jgi:hypothetical protein